ncbi:MAG: ComF family protein [Treponema sp.]
MNIRTTWLKSTQLVRRMYAALLSPQYCMLCNQPSKTALPLCPHCIECGLKPYTKDAGTPLYNSSRCLHCGRPLISEQTYCTECRGSELDSSPSASHFCTRIFALYPYIGLGQKLMPAWKNQNIRSFSAVFAPLLAAFILQQPELRGLPIVPVPPRANKLRSKGWDQMQDISRHIAACSDIALYPCLRRTGKVPQKQLSRNERMNNIMHSITVSAKRVPEALIVIDDVMTTGATLEACAHALIAHGCKKVYGLCLFFN